MSKTKRRSDWFVRRAYMTVFQGIHPSEQRFHPTPQTASKRSMDRVLKRNHLIARSRSRVNPFREGRRLKFTPEAHLSFMLQYGSKFSWDALSKAQQARYASMFLRGVFIHLQFPHGFGVYNSRLVPEYNKANQRRVVGYFRKLIQIEKIDLKNKREELRRERSPEVRESIQGMIIRKINLISILKSVQMGVKEEMYQW